MKTCENVFHEQDKMGDVNDNTSTLLDGICSEKKTLRRTEPHRGPLHDGLLGEMPHPPRQPSRASCRNPVGQKQTQVSYALWHIATPSKLTIEIFYSVKDLRQDKEGFRRTPVENYSTVAVLQHLRVLSRADSESSSACRKKSSKW